MTVLRLALLEFWRAFPGRAPGGRDWAFVTALLVLLQLLALVMLSARAGVLERSVDAFLGKEPGYGVPVWVRQNYLSERPTESISADLIAELEAASDSHRVVPFRRVANGELVTLPDPAIWLERAEESEIAFSGLVGDFGGPLFPTVMAPDPDPGPLADIVKDAWPIVLDLDKFQDFFDLEAYRASIAGRVPRSMYEAIPTDPAMIGTMSVIWLEVQRLRTPTLVPFRITWGRYLGNGHLRPDFVLPFEFHTAFMAVRENPLLCAEVASGPDLPRPVTSIESISLLMQPEDTRKETIADLRQGLSPMVQALGGEFSDNTRARLTWVAPQARGSSECRGSVPWIVAALFIAHEDLDNGMIESMPKTPARDVVVSGTKLRARCDSLAPNTRRRVLGDAVFTAPCGEDILEVELADAHLGYNQILMFVKDRTRIDALVDYISCREGDGAPVSSKLCHLPDADYDTVESRLALHPIYEDSLSRFGFLSKLLEAISGPIGFIIGAVVFAMLFVQLGTVIGHRLGQYATLIVNGVRHSQVYRMVIAQIVLSVVAAFAVACALFVVVRGWLLLETRQLSSDYERITLGGGIDILPIPVSGMVAVICATLLIGCALGLVHLYAKGVSAGKSLDRLL